jgi:hypothetical protein
MAQDPENLEMARDECGWAFDHDSDEQAVEQLRALAQHPALNRWLPADGHALVRNWQPQPSMARLRCRSG